MKGTNGSRPRSAPRGRAGRHGGFTLIELLVVVSIIALLIAILLPSLRRARDQAKRVKCFANLHAIQLALVCYADDNKQELPSYATMGGWGMRAAPGQILRGKKNEGGYPETYGLQAVLHNGCGPRIQPNGLAVYEKRSPVYLPGESEVWICPANPGPKDKSYAGARWAEFGNTYYYRTNSGGTDDFAQPGDPDWTPFAKRVYNIDWLNRNTRLGSLALLVNDNYIYYMPPSGMGRPTRTSDYTVLPTELRQAPHRASHANTNISQFWCAAYADGHCNMNAWNH